MWYIQCLLHFSTHSMNGKTFLQVFFGGEGSIDLFLEVRRLRRFPSWDFPRHPPAPSSLHLPDCPRNTALSKKVGVWLLQLQVLCEEMWIWLFLRLWWKENLWIIKCRIFELFWQLCLRSNAFFVYINRKFTWLKRLSVPAMHAG